MKLKIILLSAGIVCGMAAHAADGLLDRAGAAAGGGGAGCGDLDDYKERARLSDEDLARMLQEQFNAESSRVNRPVILEREDDDAESVAIPPCDLSTMYTFTQHTAEGVGERLLALRQEFKRLSALEPNIQALQQEITMLDKDNAKLRAALVALTARVEALERQVAVPSETSEERK